MRSLHPVIQRQGEVLVITVSAVARYLMAQTEDKIVQQAVVMTPEGCHGLLPMPRGAR